MRTIPLILAHATLTLYHADAAGNPILSEPVWMGARVEELELLQEIEELETTPSGAIHPEFTQGFESHEIRIGRIWVLSSRPAGRDYQMSRGQFVMIIFGEERSTGIWHKRTYYGVQARRYDLRSRGVMHFGADQSFRAKYLIPDHGINSPSGSVAGGCTEQPILFIHEFPLLAPGYLIGVCQLPIKAQITTAKAIAFAGQTMPTVLTLEIDGTLSPHVLTLPAGEVNEEVAASTTLNLTVDANTLLRWKATDGPNAAEDAVSMIGLTMNVKEMA